MMFSGQSRSFKSRMQRMRSIRGLSVSTLSEDAEETAIKPSSNSSRGSRGSNSSGGSFRLRLRRRNNKKPPNRQPPQQQQRQVQQPEEEERPLSPPAELRLQLLPRIAEYRARGWINAKDEVEFVQMLTENPVNSGNTIDSVAIQVKQALDLAYERQEQSSSSGAVLAPPPPPPPPPKTRSVDKENIPHQQVSTKQKNIMMGTLKQQQPPTTRDSTAQGNKKCIVDPRDLNKGPQDSSEVQDLFVEMCFFARLGFVQPPSCLRCVYRESMDNKAPDTSCQRWVPWRKNAKTLLHPHRLAGNIVLVKCHAARSLLNGDTVQAHQWDKDRKVLIYHT